MKLEEAIEITKNYYGLCIPKNEIAEVLGLTVQAVRKRIRSGGLIKYDECFKLSNKYKLPVKLYFQEKELPKTIEINYIDIKGYNFQKHPRFKSYFMDFQLAYEIFERSFDKDNIKIISAPNNMLSDRIGHLYINRQDLILLDLSKTNISDSGLYLYTCKDGYYNIAYIRETEKGTSFEFSNPHKTEIRTKDYLIDVNFQPRARVIKNLFYIQ